ncbi:ATP-binding protein [Bacillus sp. 1P02SD]|uniref:hybrid sensor histidine kinase/response regulator n=1 Tax=Bacillus sp. 1P02SD TaxID=3132264 RepID=UPI00399F7AD9
MKVIDYINQSISRQVLGLMGICFLFFITGTIFLFHFQKNIQNEYVGQRESIESKQEIISTIYEKFNADILIVGNSISFKLPDHPEMVDNEAGILITQKDELRKLLVGDDEREYFREIESFIDYYHSAIVPRITDEYGKTDDPRVDIIDEYNYTMVEGFFNQMNEFRTLLEEELSMNADTFNEKNRLVINSFYILFVAFFLILLLVSRRFVLKISRPLSEFTFSANEIAAGRDAVIKADAKRKDELGTLFIAFQKMAKSIQDKEQDLVAHNEELLAQQDELQAQQEELRATLEFLTENEQKLKTRNDLINGISSSLDKKDVLQSIVKSMVKITKSDKGIITYLHEDSFASIGISEGGINQFRSHLDSGLIQRVAAEKKANVVKRDQNPEEKGYHDVIQYSYDLYIPIVSDSHVIAIMVYTRLGTPFSSSEINEYETLSKQIAIYLEKIKMFEESEDDRKLNQDILNTVEEGIQLIDRDREIVQVNQNLYKTFNGIQIENLLGLTWSQWSQLMADQVQEDHFIESLDELIKAANHQPEKEHSFIYRKKDSKQVIRVYCRTKKHGEEEFGSLLVHRDITKEFEITQMKNELVSTVSHELRTPLASVLGFTELLLTKDLKPERKTKYLQTIYNEAKRLTALINDFLDIQRMESGRQTYEKNYINMKTVLENVIELQQVNTTVHTITFSNELDDAVILGEQNKMEQVFTNLLSNAIKYSPNGGNINIRLYGNKRTVSIDIKDEGLGIPEDALPNLFQPFYRVDNSDRRRIGGTGLGLSLVKEIVKAHGGSITVDSLYGKGSTFTTQFPRVKVQTRNKEKHENNDISDIYNPRYKIMVIEDDLNLSELLKHELRDCGFYVEQFTRGEEALEKMKIDPPDAVVLDIMLEDRTDGWSIMKEMNENKELKSIPIFVSSALDEKEIGFSLGAKEYLIKPYKPSQLSKLIMQTLLENEKDGQIMVSHAKRKENLKNA